MKRIIRILLIAIICISAVSCAPAAPQQYRTEFLGTFDTVVTLIGYTDSEAEFEEAAQIVQDTFTQLHQMFDIYYEYDGINNVKTINDNAGIAPVAVDAHIIDLLQTAIEWHERTDGAVNIATGPVLAVWHEYRDAGIDDPDSAALPTMDELEDAAQYTDINAITIDEENATVYIEENMRIDVGAIAKGYATQAAAEALRDAGFDSMLISAGGNVVAVGAPQDDRTKWGVGVKDPASELAQSTSEANILDAAYVADLSVVSSGSYERYYEVDGERYHHLIDPETLFPATYYVGVTVITADSTVADVLSTAVFVLSPDEALALIESMDDTEALWVTEDGEITLSSGMAQYLRDLGGATNE